MTSADREKLKHLKEEVNSPKSKLIQLAMEVANVSPKQAESLEKIIGKLEAWQNR